MSSVRIGFVSLVGAGPGDPEVLTRKALARLRRADLVLYDALVDPRVLTLGRRARRFFVGKRAGRHALSQEAIHALMIRAATRGHRVVRLKGGDPFVFGRGGEEALALQQAGVPFEVVPGVTSVVAAPSSAGIPLTHRGLSAAFFVVSGHDRQLFSDALGALTPNQITLVILMGFARRVSLAAELMEKGWRAKTPAAIVSDGTNPSAAVWRGTLGDLAAGRMHARTEAPAVIVVGEVAALDVKTTVLQEPACDEAPRARRSTR
ncbi:MAG: uroporphyrinogen-III C-methyltransferase [Acidobacteriaceae bacterium]|nr:uroporphyrinogen-III C-methyltransferase [Acidobacteriaceae bacterium]